MSRSILALICLISTTGAMAEQITPDEAESAALNFFTSRHGMSRSKDATVSLAYVPADSDTPAYYVFRRDNIPGFVVISGDDDMPQIVGYSYTNPFDAEMIPDGLKAFFSGYTSIVDAVREGTVRPAAEPAGGPAIGPLMQVQWDQDAPYNNKCPRMGVQRAATGCVATAMAQIMKYHAYPSNGYGTVVWNNRTFDLSASSYDWSMMPDRYISGSYTPDEADQVAQLMLDCGHAVQMEYGEESGALTEYVAPALVKNFGYDGGIQYQMRSGWSDDGWTGLIRSNLEQGLPVIYGGNGNLGGHQFICDGIDTSDLLHINWGWSGMSDGFYDINALSPEDVGIGGSAVTFNNDQDIICWIRPASESNSVPETWQPHLASGYMEILTKTDSNGRYQVASTDKPAIRASFEIDNATGGRITFRYGYVIYDINGVEVSRSINLSGTLHDAGYYIPEAIVSVSVGNLPTGKYHISWRWQNTMEGATSGLQEFWTGDTGEGFWIEVRPDGYYATTGTPSGTEPVITDLPSWQITSIAGQFELSGAPEHTCVRVYSVDGAHVSTTVTAPDCRIIDMTGSRPGLYIISATAPDGTSESFKSVLRY